MTDSTEQAKLAIQYKLNTDSIFAPKRGNEIAALYERPQSNSGALNPQEYLDMAIPAWREYCKAFEVAIPENVHASDSAPTGFKKMKANAKPNESRQHNNLVTVWQTGKDGDENRDWRIYIANQVIDPIDVLTCLLGGLLLTVVGKTKTDKFPQGELTFKSDAYDEIAEKVGFTKKYRGNLALNVTKTLLNAATRIRESIGDCPIKAIVPQDAADKSGLKQTATNYKAVCENALCDYLKEKDSKGATNKPFAISNIGSTQVDYLERIGQKMNCPVCNPTADPKGSFLRFVDPRAEKEAKQLADAAKLLADKAAKDAALAEENAKLAAKAQAEAEAIAKDKATRDAAIAQAKADTLAKIEAEKQAKEAGQATQPEEKPQAPIATVIAGNNVAEHKQGKKPANKGKAS